MNLHWATLDSGDFFFDFELLSHQANIVVQIALGDEAVLIERSQGELGRSSPRNRHLFEVVAYDRQRFRLVGFQEPHSFQRGADYS